MGIAERREREKLRRRKDILDAAEKIFFLKGFNAATMAHFTSILKVKRSCITD